MSEQPAKWKTIASKVFFHPITRIILGFVGVGLAAGLIPFACMKLMKALHIDDVMARRIASLISPAAALAAYILIYRYYEKREITELRPSAMPGGFALGALVGIGLQSLVILTIYLLGGYQIVSINPISYIIPGLLIAISSGITEEVLFRGVIFRIIDQRWGAIAALTVSAVLFGVIHMGNPGASLYSAIAIAIEAGILLGACYMYAGNLWLPIGVHFGWNFAEADLYGGILSGNELHKTLITAQFTGSEYLTGGSFGPENSIPAMIICTGGGLLFLWLAYRKKAKAATTTDQTVTSESSI